MKPEQYTQWFSEAAKMMDPARYAEWLRGFADMTTKIYGERAPQFMPALPSADIYKGQFENWARQMDPSRYASWFEKQMRAFSHLKPDTKAPAN